MLLKETFRLKTFINADGYYTIWQDDADEGGVIVLSPDQMRKIIEDMSEYLEKEGEWWSVESDEGGE